MVGVITTRNLVTDARAIVENFGWATYWRCWRSVLLGKKTTFLTLALAWA